MILTSTHQIRSHPLNPLPKSVDSPSVPRIRTSYAQLPHPITEPLRSIAEPLHPIAEPLHPIAERFPTITDCLTREFLGNAAGGCAVVGGLSLVLTRATIVLRGGFALP